MSRPPVSPHHLLDLVPNAFDGPKIIVSGFPESKYVLPLTLCSDDTAQDDEEYSLMSSTSQ
jgi:hypothetical protein